MTIEDYGGIVSLSEEQYTLLKLNGQIEVEGVTIIYSPTSTAYAIKDTRTLLAPKSAPLENQIVAINPEGKQQMLNVGDGLSIENGALKASSTGNKLYLHCLRMSGGTSSQWGVNIINSSSDLFTGDTFKNYLINNHKGYVQMLIVNGYYTDKVVWGTYYDETTQTTRVRYGWYTTAGVVGDESYNPGYINDYVIEL